MSDPDVQHEIGRVPDVFGGPLIIGVEHGCVTLGHEHLEKFMLTEAAAEDFAQMFIRACWVAAQQHLDGGSDD